MSSAVAKSSIFFYGIGIKKEHEILAQGIANLRGQRNVNI